MSTPTPAELQSMLSDPNLPAETRAAAENLLAAVLAALAEGQGTEAGPGANDAGQGRQRTRQGVIEGEDTPIPTPVRNLLGPDFERRLP